MALVTLPLLSFGASGKVAGTAVFVCGKIVRKVPAGPRKDTEPRQAVNNKFKQGVWIWNYNDEPIQQEWIAFYVWKKIYYCGEVKEEVALNGFKAWMRFFMKLYPTEWPNFPFPPGLSPEYPKNYWSEYFD